MQVNRVQKLMDFLAQEPQDPFLKYALATEYLSQNQLSEALKYFEDLIVNHSDYIGTYYHLGALYEKLGRKEDAISTYSAGMLVARQLRDMHALSELQTVYNAACGLDYEDD